MRINHHLREFMVQLLMSGIIAGITYSQNTNQSNQFGYAQPTAGSVMSHFRTTIGRSYIATGFKNLNVSPTINVRPGYRFQYHRSERFNV